MRSAWQSYTTVLRSWVWLCVFVSSKAALWFLLVIGSCELVASAVSIFQKHNYTTPTSTGSTSRGTATKSLRLSTVPVVVAVRC